MVTNREILSVHLAKIIIKKKTARTVKLEKLFTGSILFIDCNVYDKSIVKLRNLCKRETYICVYHTSIGILNSLCLPGSSLRLQLVKSA